MTRMTFMINHDYSESLSSDLPSINYMMLLRWNKYFELKKEKIDLENQN